MSPRDDDLLTTRQVAELFDVSVSSVARWARIGRIPSVRTPGGGALRFERAAIEALFESLRREATEAVA